MDRSKALRPAALLALLWMGVVAAAPVSAQLVVEEVLVFAIETSEEGEGWFLLIEVSGTGLDQGLVTPPVGEPIELDCFDFGSFTDCFFESLAFPALAALNESFPDGEWQLSLNEGEATAMLNVTFVEPGGAVTVVSPADGAVGVGATPAIEFAHDCGNCVALPFELFSFDAFPLIELEAVVFGDPPFDNPPPASGALELADFESLDGGPPPGELPGGVYGVLARAAVGSVTDETLSNAQEFEFVNAAFRTRFSTFTVPEPGAVASAGAAVMALLGLARRRSIRARGR